MSQRKLIQWAAMMPRKILLLLATFIFTSNFIHHAHANDASLSNFWKNATIYFMMTDRFNNGDPTNDKSYQRNENAAVLRGFEGGDIQGVINKIEDGYFSDLGVDAIWMTPVIEQIHGYDTSDNLTYAYHGYWPKDWTTVDKNFGSEADLARMIELAHQRGIRVLVDVIINHTGPKTDQDNAWPDSWVRTEPLCNWSDFANNVQCALATSLTDLKTESEAAVELPDWLLQKWQSEGRVEIELAELDAFFKRTGYPKAPKYYLIKWLTDWVRDYGVDGFRVDTVKHTEAEIWRVLKKESELAFNSWKMNHPEKVIDAEPFYMVGEVFNWGALGFANAVDQGRAYDYGDKQVDFFDYGFDALINMGFIEHIKMPIEELYISYSDTLSKGDLQGKGLLHYLGSHDDHNSYDRGRENTFENAFKLMMAPGGVQIYYGDEIARPMIVTEAYGDASMRSFMNWQDLQARETKQLLQHWQKLGKFRQQFEAVGAGLHHKIEASPYTFSRTLSGEESVVIVKGAQSGLKTLTVGKVFENGATLKDYYSGVTATVKDGRVTLNSPYNYVLLAKQ